MGVKSLSSEGKGHTVKEISDCSKPISLHNLPYLDHSSVKEMHGLDISTSRFYLNATRFTYFSPQKKFCG